MTTRREVPIAPDTLAWVHKELSEIKSKLSQVSNATEQNRSRATDASDEAERARLKAEQLNAADSNIERLQDDLRMVLEQLTRAQEDISSLRLSRDDLERRGVLEAERGRQERNETGRRFEEVERNLESWFERAAGYDEHGRRNVETAAQLAMRLEAIEGQVLDADSLQSRAQTTVSRVDNELQRLTSTITSLEREDEVLHERSNNSLETLRRLESELEAVKTVTSRISRLDDRLELVQAERTRHNEHLNDIAGELAKIDGRLNTHGERMALLEVRMGGYQDELRGTRAMLQADREAIGGYLHGLAELEADMRKRAIIALEKEIRDIRGRALDFTEE